MPTGETSTLKKVNDPRCCLMGGLENIIANILLLLLLFKFFFDRMLYFQKNVSCK